MKNQQSIGWEGGEGGRWDAELCERGGYYVVTVREGGGYDAELCEGGGWR